MSQLIPVLRRLVSCIPLMILFLTACKTLTPSIITTSAITPEWLQHKQAVEQITRYKVKGSLLYTAGFKKEYARFFLQQDSARNYRLLLLSPLGNTELDLRVNEGVVNTINSKGEHYRSTDLDDTLRRLTGMSLPLDSIRLWILGLPGESKQFLLSDNNRLKEALLDAGSEQWDVQYQSYNTEVVPPLPERLEMNNGEQRIKLKIDSWSFE